MRYRVREKTKPAELSDRVEFTGLIHQGPPVSYRCMCREAEVWYHLTALAVHLLVGLDAESV